MTSMAQLPPDLIAELFAFTEPFHASSSRFLTRITRDDKAGENQFLRVCELHNTLELLASSSLPLRQLWELRRGGGGGSGGSGGGGAGGGGGMASSNSGDDKETGETNQDAEDLVGFFLNAEFVLYAIYADFELALNPSLAHWVGICREFDKYTRAHSGVWGIRERVLKIRAAFVMGILAEQGGKVCAPTCFME